MTEIARIQRDGLGKAYIPFHSPIGKNIFPKSPVTSKDVKRFREDIVVNQAGVDTEEPHHGYDVSTTKKDIKDLIRTSFLGQWIFFKDQK